jgi:hypothetical protein
MIFLTIVLVTPKITRCMGASTCCSISISHVHVPGYLHWSYCDGNHSFVSCKDIILTWHLVLLCFCNRKEFYIGGMVNTWWYCIIIDTKCPSVMLCLVWRPHIRYYVVTTLTNCFSKHIIQKLKHWN